MNSTTVALGKKVDPTVSFGIFSRSRPVFVSAEQMFPVYQHISIGILIY